MNRCFYRSLALTLFVLGQAVFAQAQGVYVYCTRDVDHVKVDADSIRIECLQFGIDTVVKGSVFVAPTITGVDDTHASDLGLNTNFDLFDLRGAFIGRRSQLSINQTMVGGLQWVDGIGLVIARPLQEPRASHASKFDYRISTVPELRVTAWRNGYLPASTVCAYPTKENVAVQLLLELKPWWQRMRRVQGEVTVPQILYTVDGYGGHGGSAYEYHYKGIAKNLTIKIDLGLSKNDSGLYTPWYQQGQILSYNLSGPYVTVHLFCSIEFDSMSGHIRSLILEHWVPLPDYRDHRKIKLVTIPELKLLTPGRMHMHLVDSLANASLESLQHETWLPIGSLATPSHEVTHRGPHLPADKGIQIVLEMTLID